MEYKYGNDYLKMDLRYLDNLLLYINESQYIAIMGFLNDTQQKRRIENSKYYIILQPQTIKRFIPYVCSFLVKPVDIIY